ncbi:MAG: J domain-containing protein [Aquihabitans sp.]
MTERVASHYQRLGVTPSASTEEIRSAYRALASRLHPDHSTGSSAAERALAERRMREINESWRVLQDLGRRRAYDDSRLTGTGRPQAPRRPSTRLQVAEEVDDDLVDMMPPMSGLTAGFYRHGPWVVLVVVFVLIFVVSAYAGGHDESPAPPEPIAEVGDCIDVETGTDTIVVPCTGAHEFEIVASVARPADCPPGSEGRRFARDGHFDCIVPGP